jgi:hypothetical protein
MADKPRRPISCGFLGAPLGLFAYLFVIPANPGIPATVPQVLTAQIWWTLGSVLIGGLAGEILSLIARSMRNV